MEPVSQHPTLIEKSLQESLDVKQSLLEMVPAIERAGQMWIETLKKGGKILFAGNGGSAADAQHLAAELVGRFERENGFAALALTTDSSTLLALANDYSFQQVFSRQVQALAREGDLLVAISTSGNSGNVLEAVKSARDLGCRTLGFSGGSGGQLMALCDHCLVAPSQRVCRIQEAHITLGHILCELVEASLPTPGVSPQCV